jgi:hypothetical protein
MENFLADAEGQSNGSSPIRIQSVRKESEDFSADESSDDYFLDPNGKRVK